MVSEKSCIFALPKRINMELTRNIDKEYLEWIAELSQRYRQSQIKAAVKVNSEMLRFYWSISMTINTALISMRI